MIDVYESMKIVDLRFMKLKDRAFSLNKKDTAKGLFFTNLNLSLFA